jgi:hypothetical protein
MDVRRTLRVGACLAIVPAFGAPLSAAATPAEKWRAVTKWTRASEARQPCSSAKVVRRGCRPRLRHRSRVRRFAPSGAPWRPYGQSSPWNQLVPANALVHPRSAEVMTQIASWGRAQDLLAGHSNSGWDYYHPIYFSSSTDPLFELRATQRWGTAEIEGHRIRIPDAARPASGGDHHMAVITEEGWEYDLWSVSSKPDRAGRLEFGWGGRTRIDGDGLGSNATAAHYGLAAGIIRAPELEAGYIAHGLFMGVRCTAPKLDAVYPAAPNTGEPCSDVPDENAPPMGSRFVLDMSAAEIAGLRVPRWKKTILTALAEYGAIVGDAIGSGSWGLQLESGAAYTSFGFEDPFAALARRQGVPSWNGMHVFKLDGGFDWRRRLRLLHPCVTAGNC